MNGIIGTAIVLAIVIGIVALVIRSMIKTKKAGNLVGHGLGGSHIAAGDHVGVGDGAQQVQQASAAGIQDNDIFLKLELSRSKVVVGEPIIATLKLYQRVNIGGFENVTFPTFNGFWMQD